MITVSVTEKFKTDLNDWLNRHYKTVSGEWFDRLSKNEQDRIALKIEKNAIEILQVKMGDMAHILELPNKYKRTDTGYEYLYLSADHFSFTITTPFGKASEVKWRYV